MGGERAPSACGCFSAASTVPHKRYNALVKQLYTKAHVVHVSPDLERPVPKSVAMLLGKLEDYLTRSPHRAPKVFRRLRRNCDIAVAAVIGSGTIVGAGLDGSGAGAGGGDDDEEYDVNLARVRVSLEAFDLLLMIDKLRADDVIVGAELLPLLMSLMSKGLSTSSSSAPPPAAAAAASKLPRKANAKTLRCFGCFYMHRFVASLDDLTFAESVDAVVGIVHDIVLEEINANSSGVLPAENRCCEYAVRVLHEIVRYCRRTGHIVKKMRTIVVTLLLWIEATANSSSTVTAAVDATNHTKIVMSPLPVSTTASALGSGVSAEREGKERQGSSERGDDSARRAAGDASASSSPSSYADAESEVTEHEAIQALRELVVLGSDLETAKLTIAPVLTWLSDVDGAASSGAAPCRWTEPVGAIVSSTLLASYVDDDQGYVLLQLVLQDVVGSKHLASATQHGFGCLAAEVRFVERSLQSLEDELAVPALLLLFKELLPVVDIGGGGDGGGDNEDAGVAFQSSLIELLSSAAVKLGNCLHLLHVIAAVLSRAVYMNKRQLSAAARVDENTDIRKAAECLKTVACATVERLGANSEATSRAANDDDDGDDNDDSDEDEAATGAGSSLSGDFPLALSNELCRAFLTSATLSTATSHQISQQVAVLELFTSCLSLTTSDSDRRGTGSGAQQMSFVPSILTPSKSAPENTVRAPEDVVSRHQLLTLLSSIYLRLTTSSSSPAFIVAVDQCFRRLLSTNTADVVLPVALPMALAVQELALYGWSDTKRDVLASSSSASSSASSTAEPLKQLRLLMLSFSMLRHIGTYYECAELPKEAHPRSVQGLIDGENGICLDPQADSSAGAGMSGGDDVERVLSLFVNEFDNKGGVGSARDSVVNAILSKYAISSSISKTSKQELGLAFSPLKENLLLQTTMAAAPAALAPRSPAPASAHEPSRHGSRSNVIGNGARASVPGIDAGADDGSGQSLPSVRDVLDRILLGKPRSALASESSNGAASFGGTVGDADDDASREDAIRALNGTLAATEGVDVELEPSVLEKDASYKASYKALPSSSPTFIDSAMC